MVGHLLFADLYARNTYILSRISPPVFLLWT